MTISELLNLMFPENKAQGWPSFKQSGSTHPVFKSLNLQKRIENALTSINVDGDTDVECILTEMQMLEPELTEKFCEQALEAYFTSVAIVSKLNEGETTLFPHYRSLSDINFDLLTPVINRSELNEDG